MTIGHSHHIPLPDLRIVPTNAIQPHEDEDAQRAKPLVASIQNDGVLRNPIIVTPLEYGLGYLLLDGTNRYTAFRQLDIAHMLVQAVPYQSPAVELASWNHILGNANQQDLLNTVHAISDDDDVQQSTKPISDSTAIARITLMETNEVIYLTHPTMSLAEKMTFLRKLVNAYISLCRLNRSASSEMDELLTTYPDMTALVEFIPLAPSDIQTLTHDGHKVPAGVTRHIIQGRALRVNYPLAYLQSSQSLENKNAALEQWMNKKFADRNVRLYTEATYQFEE